MLTRRARAALLRRATDEGVTTMLDGEGGDALFRLSPYLLADRLCRATRSLSMRASLSVSM